MIHIRNIPNKRVPLTPLWFLALIPFLGIYGIRNAIGTSVYQLWQIASVSYFLLVLLCSVRRIRVNGFVGLFALYQIDILFIATVRQGLSFGILTMTAAAIILFILLQSASFDSIIQALCVIVVLCAVINAASMLRGADSREAYYFIGGKNALSMFLLPGVFLVLLRAVEKKHRISAKTVLFVIICLASVLVGGSGTGIVVTLAAAALLLLSVRHAPPKRLYIVLIAIMYLVLLLASEEFFDSKFWLSFTDALGKDNTLTSRGTIWSVAKGIIGDSPFFGAGRGTQIVYINSLGVTTVIYEAHNLVLEILLEGGITALTIFSLLLAKIIRFLDVRQATGRIIFIGLCVILLNGLTESNINSFFVTIILGAASRYAAESREAHVTV